MVEEPVYEAAPEPELEPELEPEPEYEDVGLERQDEDAEGDYEDVLEPEDTRSLSYQAGEWGKGGGESSSQVWLVLGQQRRGRSLLSVCLPSL